MAVGITPSPNVVGPTGPTGATGPTGPTGPTGAEAVVSQRLTPRLALHILW